MPPYFNLYSFPGTQAEMGISLRVSDDKLNLTGYFSSCWVSDRPLSKSEKLFRETGLVTDNPIMLQEALSYLIPVGLVEWPLSIFSKSSKFRNGGPTTCLIQCYRTRGSHLRVQSTDRTSRPGSKYSTWLREL